MVQTILSGLICGILLGFVLQRGRFCITGAFRDLYLTRENRMFVAFLLAISVQSVGIFLLSAAGVIQLTNVPFAWLGAIVGGFVFGVGMVCAGGCATGTWYRAGEGLIGSWVALFAYMASSAMMKHGSLQPLNQFFGQYKVEQGAIYETFGLSPWLLILLLAGVTGYLVWRHLKQPAVRIPSLPPRRKGLAHLLFEKRWHPFVTAVLVGLIATLAWPLSEATGRMFGLGITTPSANLLGYLVTGETKMLDWGVFLVLGILVGSFIAAKGSREFRWRVPSASTMVTSFIGGLLMGFGASIAGGCTIGNGLVNTALLAWQGWVAMPFMLAGSWVATYFLMVRPRQRSRQAAVEAVQGA